MRRFTKLGLRTLFALVAACCVLAAFAGWKIRDYRAQQEFLRNLERRLGPLDAFGVTVVPAKPQWFWKRVAGEDAKDVVEARLFQNPMKSAAVGLTKQEFEGVGRWSRLRQVMLGGDAIDDDAMATLRGLPDLFDLMLMETRVGSDGVAKLRGHGALKRLEMRRHHKSGDPKPTLSAKAIEALATTPITELELWGYSLDASAIAALGKLGGLEILRLTDADLNDEAMVEIAKLKNLRGLDISWHGQVTDAGIQLLSNLDRLDWAAVEGTGATVDGLEKLGKTKPKFDIDTGKLWVSEIMRDQLRRRKAATPAGKP